MASLALVTPPTAHVLDVDDLRDHCRVAVGDDDLVLEAYLGAAVGRVEDVTGRQLLQATYDLRLDGWPCGGIELPRPPLASVTYIRYLDTAGAEQTWASSNYVVDAPSGPRATRGWVTLASGQSWPSVLDQANAITVRFVAGYGTGSASVPEPIKQAIRLMVGDWYENREDAILGTTVQPVSLSAKLLLKPFVNRPTQLAA